MAGVLGLALSALGGVPLAGQEATKEQAQAALREYDALATNKNAHVRKAAVDGLAGVNHHLVTTALLAAAKDADPGVRAAAIAALGTQTNTLGLADLVQRAWRGPNKSERLAILKAFEQSRPPSALTAVLDLLAASDWEIRAAAVAVAGGFPDADGRITGALLPLVGDQEPLVRLAALDALDAVGSPRALPGAVKALQDADWRIRASGIRVLRRLRDKAAIQPLIDVLKTEKGRLLDDALQALVDLAGQDHTADPARWQEWWDRVKDGFKVPTREELAEKERQQAVRREGYDPPPKGEYPPYHGVKTRSRSLLFLIDISSSMAEQVTLDSSQAAEVEDFRKRYGDRRVKIDIAREELINLIAALPAYARFNVITFNARVEAWQKGLVNADGPNKNSAIKFLARLTVPVISPPGRPLSGQTNTCEALNAAFGLMSGQEPLTKNTYKTEADTVFLLSDGLPTTGSIVEPQTLLDHVAQVNRRAKVVLHTIAFGSANRYLMEGLARQNGGQYVRIGG